MAPFDPSHTSFYSPFIVTMALSSIVCEIWRLIGRKSRNFYTPPVFSAPAGGGGDPVGISWRCLMLIKLTWLGYRMVPERYGRTGRQTDRQTDILYQYRASVCWRAIKNRHISTSGWTKESLKLAQLKSVVHTTYNDTRRRLGEDLNAATESAVPTSV